MLLLSGELSPADVSRALRAAFAGLSDAEIVTHGYVVADAPAVGRRRSASMAPSR
ncbi:MAG: hypothetical protein ACYDAN_05240 [Candidatus Limnocylindrales bacterium]